jgi:hypothetical protein
MWAEPCTADFSAFQISSRSEYSFLMRAISSSIRPGASGGFVLLLLHRQLLDLELDRRRSSLSITSAWSRSPS